MASESNAAQPDPAVAPPPPPTTPVPPAPAPVYAAPRPAFTTAPVGWVIAGMLVFWPTGIPALLASHRAARAFGAADVETAQREAANARRWGIISVIVAASLLLLWILMWIAWFAFLVAAHHGDDGIWHERQGWSNEQPFNDSRELPSPPGSGRNG